MSDWFWSRYMGCLIGWAVAYHLHDSILFGIWVGWCLTMLVDFSCRRAVRAAVERGE